MAARFVTGGDAADRETNDVRLLGFRPERRDDRVKWPHPVERAGLIRLLAPAHGFRPGESLDHVGKNFTNDVDGRTARLFDRRDVKVALLVGLHLRFADGFEPGGFQKSGDGVVGRADARAFLLLADIGLPRRHALHRERQPPRRHEGSRAIIDKPGIDQPVGHRFAQVVAGARLHARRNFLGEKLKQQVGHASYPLPPREGKR